MKIIITNNGITQDHLQVKVGEFNKEDLDGGEFLVVEEDVSEYGDSKEFKNALKKVEDILRPSDVYNTGDLLEMIFSTVFALGVRIGGGKIEIPYERDDRFDLFDEVD